MNNELDEIVLKLMSVVNDEQSFLFVCDKDNAKLLLNYIEKLNILINELDTICYTYVPYPECRMLIQDRLENLKKYEEILYEEE